MSELPMEIDVENKKLTNIEVNLQEILQLIEFEVEDQEEFQAKLQSARTTLSSLKNSFEKFSSLLCEWDNVKSLEKKLSELLTSHRTSLHSFETQFQRSCLKGQKRVQTLEKSALLTNSTRDSDNESNLRHRKQQRKTHAANQAQEATINLRRVANMLDDQVKQGVDSHDILESSSQQITKIGDEYKGLSGLIAISRKLLNKYNRREMTDTLLIFFGLILFFATVIFIVSKRI